MSIVGQSKIKTWDDLTELAATISEAQDKAQWDLGDLAVIACSGHLSDVPGDEDVTLAEFAKHIKRSKGAVSEWKNVAKLFPPFARANRENLSFSHYRRAYRASKDEDGNPDFDKAMGYIDMAQDGTWSVDQMGTEIAKMNGSPIFKDVTFQDYIEMIKPLFDSGIAQFKKNTKGEFTLKRKPA